MLNTVDKDPLKMYHLLIKEETRELIRADLNADEHDRIDHQLLLNYSYGPTESPLLIYL